MDAQGSGISSFTSGNLCLQSSDGSGISGFTLFSSSLSFRGRSVLGLVASQSASITLDAISALDSQNFVTTMVTDVNVTLAGPVVIAAAGADGVLIAPGAIGNSGGNFIVLRNLNVLARSGRSSGGSTVALVGAGRSVVLIGATTSPLSSGVVVPLSPVLSPLLSPLSSGLVTSPLSSPLLSSLPSSGVDAEVAFRVRTLSWMSSPR